MRTDFKLSTKAWVAVILVGLFLSVAAVTGRDLFGGVLYAASAFSTGAVAALDSTHIHLRRYKTWLSYGPIGVFLVCALFWPFTIIWYFVVRLRIVRGTMPLRDKYKGMSV